MDGEEERPEGQEAPLVGFIFGNVEEKTGRVEADYLDEVRQPAVLHGSLRNSPSPAIAEVPLLPI